MASRMMPSAALWSDTSALFATALPPADVISFTTSCAGPALGSEPSSATPRSLTTTEAPSRANSLATPAPIPRPAPVTTATRPSRTPIESLLVWWGPPRPPSSQCEQLPRFLGQAERTLPDDVALDLARPGVDRARPAGEEDVLPQARPVLALGAPLGPDQRVRAQDIDRDLTKAAVVLAPAQLRDRGLRPRLAARRQLAQLPEPGEPHDLNLRVRP